MWLQKYDATQLILKQGPIAQPILIDQGREDNFLQDRQLLPEAFEAACTLVDQKVTLRMQVKKMLHVLLLWNASGLVY